MKGYAEKSLETDINDGVAGRSAQSVQKPKGYIGSVLDFISQYTSKLNTRAKAGFAATCLVAAGFGADYVLSREMPASAEGASMPVMEMPVLDKNKVSVRDTDGDGRTELVLPAGYTLGSGQPEPGREQRLTAQREKLVRDWMSD